MADNRKYYYLKLKEDFFDTDEMKILESMKDGYLYSNILLKLYLKSLSNSGRLCYMLAQNREFVDTLLDNIEQEKVTKMRTAMLTRYPENKEVRGIMKLVNRVEDKKNGYKLTYEAEEGF